MFVGLCLATLSACPSSVDAFQPSAFNLKNTYRKPKSPQDTTTALSVSAGWWRGRKNTKIPMPWEKSLDDSYKHKWNELQQQLASATTLTFPVIKNHHVDIHLVDLPWLKPHEEVVSEKHVEDLLQATLGWDAYISPLLVDKTTGAILDGHHRYHVGKRLGLKRVPAVLVDYVDDHEITIDVWDGCGLKSLTKHQVLAMSLSPDVFPPKTSKHTFSDSLPKINVPLKKLKGHHHQAENHKLFFATPATRKQI